MASNIEVPAIPAVNNAKTASLPSVVTLKVKRTTWPQSEERQFLVICAENAIAEQLDNCVTSAGVSTLYFSYS
jgi:hypothetical protein